MAYSPSSTASAHGRGRGGGIRLTSYSPQFDFTYLASQTISQSTSIYKKFFAARKKSNGPRHKPFKPSLRTIQYDSPMLDENISQISESAKSNSSLPTMPTPSVPAVSPTPQSTWTQVTHGIKPSPSEASNQPVPTNNSFEVLTDDEQEDKQESTDFGSTDPDTDMETQDPPKRKPKSSRKLKKKSKKSRKSRRKHQPSDDTSDSDEDPPPRKTNKKDKLSSTQKDLFDDDSESAPNTPTPQPPRHDDDLQDSDKDTPPLKNSDIRHFMNPSQSSQSSLAPATQDNPTVSAITLNTTSDSPSPSSDPKVEIPTCRKITDRTFMLTSSTSATDINQLYRYEMISILALWYKTEAKQDGYMLNESVHSLRQHIFTLQNEMDDISSAVRITATHQEATQSRELKYRLNGSSSAQASPPSDSPALNYDSTNVGGLASVPEVSDTERLGMNVNMMMSRPITANPFRPPPTEPKSVSSKVPLTQFTARFDLSTNNTTALNVPLITRQLFRIFKKADRTLRLLPWFPDEHNDVSSIDQEEDIPVEESLIKKWVDNPRIVNSRLLFAVRVESIVEFKHIRDTFVPWMIKNNSRLKLDTLSAREIYGIGFIADVHPTLYNRSLLKDFLHAQLRKQNQQIQLNVYARNVWGTKDQKQLSCKAIVIEVDKQYRDTAAAALINIRFPPRYRYAKFVPFDKVIVPDELLNTILMSNNEYQSTTRRKIISGFSDIEHPHKTISGSKMSFREWIMSIQNPSSQEYIFEHIESSRQDIAIIFATPYADTVRDFLNKITEHLRSTFLQPNDLLSTTTTLNTRTSKVTDASLAYSKTLATCYAGNPQDPSPARKPPPKPKKIYYGAADSVQKTQLNHIMQSKKSPPPVTPPKPKPPSPSDDPHNVLQRLEKLEKESASNFEKITSRMDSKFRDLDAKREADQTKLIHSVTSVVTTSLSSSLPQLIAEQLKVAFQSTEGEDI